MLHKRILAAATATFLALGMAVGGASPAMAAKPVDTGKPAASTSTDLDNPCDQYGYTKIDSSSGTLSGEWGELEWDNTGLDLVTEPGWTIDLCLKGGNEDNVFVDNATTGSFNVTQGSISHIGWANPTYTPGEATAAIDLTDPTCFVGELLDEEGFEYENATYEISYEGDDFTVVFTADDGYEFSDGEATKTFTGTLADALEGEECTLGLAQAWLEFSAATCLDPEVVETPGDAQLENAAVKSFSVNEETGEFEVVFELADGGDAFDTNQTDFVFGDYEKSVTASYNDDFTELTLTGMLDGPNEDLCSEESATAVAPTQVNTCEVQSYTLTAAEGVEYTVTVNDGEPTVVDFGDDTEVTFMAETFDTVVITASALDGYAFVDGATTEWTFTFPLPEDCFPTFPVTTASVTWTQPDCLGNPGSYTLTNEPGVIWTVDGVVVEGNKTYTAAIGSTPSIEASLEPATEENPGGYGWSDEDQRTLWNLSFPAAEDCLPTLAITGASNALGGLGMVAVLIMMAGTGLVVARRREAARIQG